MLRFHRAHVSSRPTPWFLFQRVWVRGIENYGPVDSPSMSQHNLASKTRWARALQSSRLLTEKQSFNFYRKTNTKSWWKSCFSFASKTSVHVCLHLHLSINSIIAGWCKRRLTFPRRPREPRCAALEPLRLSVAIPLALNGLNVGPLRHWCACGAHPLLKWGSRRILHSDFHRNW